MNKIEMARQLVRQTAEHEKNMMQEEKQFNQDLISALESTMTVVCSVAENQKRMADYLKIHLPEIENNKKQLVLIRKTQKKMQVIWIMVFLMIAVPLATIIMVLVLFLISLQ